MVSEREWNKITAAIREAKRKAWDGGVRAEVNAFVYGEDNGVKVERVNPFSAEDPK